MKCTGFLARNLITHVKEILLCSCTEKVQSCGICCDMVWPIFKPRKDIDIQPRWLIVRLLTSLHWGTHNAS